ncbi:MAG: glycosyltransferase family 87 protein [Desulfobaccales bacterium]
MGQPSTFQYVRLFLVLHLVVLGAFYLFIGCYVIVGSLHQGNLIDLSGKPVGADFVGFWAASKVARTQAPAAVFSSETITAAARKVIGAEISPRHWNYPPTFLLMVLPLAAAPYLLSLLGWLALTCLGYLSVIRRIFSKNWASWLFLFFPGAVGNFLYGQNGYLSTAFLGGGLLLIDTHPFLGGAIMGLLSYKPQLAFLIPVALAAGRNWKALAGAAVSAAALVAGSLLVFGGQVWAGFFNNLFQAAGLLDVPHLWQRMPTVFAGARLLGANREWALALQAVAAAGAMGAVAWVWFRGLALPLRGSILTLGIILATPYAFEYDLAILALPFAWLGQEAYAQDLQGEESFLLLAWTGLAWATLRPVWIWPGVQQFPVNLTVLVALTLFVIYRASKTCARPPSPEVPV